MTEKQIKVLFVSSWYPSRANSMLGNFVQKHAEAASLFAEVSVLHVCFDENVRQVKPEIIFDGSGKIKTLYIYCKKSSNPLIRLRRYLRALLIDIIPVISFMYKNGKFISKKF